MSAPSLSVQINGVSQVSGDNYNTYTQWCPNIATLRSFIGVSNMLVYLEGTSTPGDGGQGPFYWNATGTSPDDNGVTTVVPNGTASGVWSRLGAAGLTLSSLTVTGNTSLLGTANNIVGTNTNNNAAAGSIGEYITASLASGSAISLTTVTPANVTSISLTAGDWEVWGSNVFVFEGSTTSTSLVAAINTTSATLPSNPGGGVSYLYYASMTGGNPIIQTGVVRMSLASTTTVYLIAQAGFAVSTASVYGFIAARRIR